MRTVSPAEIRWLDRGLVYLHPSDGRIIRRAEVGQESEFGRDVGSDSGGFG